MNKKEIKTNIVNNLVKMNQPLINRQFIENLTEEEKAIFTNKLIDASNFLNNWSKNGFVALVQDVVLKITYSNDDEINHESKEEVLYFLEKIINHPKGVIYWLIENGERVKSNDDVEFDRVKQFLPDYAINWAQAIWEIAIYWFEENITVPNDINWDGYDIQEKINQYVPQKTKNLLFDNKWYQFINHENTDELKNKEEFSNEENNDLNIEQAKEESNEEENTRSFLFEVQQESEDIEDNDFEDQKIEEAKEECKKEGRQIHFFDSRRGGTIEITSTHSGNNFLNFNNWEVSTNAFKIKNEDGTLINLKEGKQFIEDQLINLELSLNVKFGNIEQEDNISILIDSYDEQENLITSFVLAELHINKNLSHKNINYYINRKLVKNEEKNEDEFLKEAELETEKKVKTKIIAFDKESGKILYTKKNDYPFMKLNTLFKGFRISLNIEKAGFPVNLLGSSYLKIFQKGKLIQTEEQEEIIE